MPPFNLRAVLNLVDVTVNNAALRRVTTGLNNIANGARGSTARVNQLDAAINRMVDSQNRLNAAVNGTNGRLSAGARAGQLFFNRMVQFAILLPIFATLNRALQGGIKFMVEFETTLRQIIATDISGFTKQFGTVENALKNVGEASVQLASQYGQTATDFAGGVKVFVQAGKSYAESLQLAKASALAAQVSSLKLGDAQEFLIATFEAFGDKAGDASAIIDKLVAVEDIAAAEAQDLADAFRTGGNSLAFFTKSLDDTIGFVIALREQTRKSGNEIGTFSKTLVSRIAAGGAPQRAIESLGVAIKDTSGNLRPMADILQDLKGSFDSLTESQQATAAKAIAGVRQFELFIATMKSVERAQELSSLASESSGTAFKKQQIIAESTETAIAKLKGSFDQLMFALTDSGFGDFFKDGAYFLRNILDLFTSLVKVAKDLNISLMPVLTALGVLAVKKVFTGSAFGGGMAGGGIGGGFGGGGGGGGGGGRGRGGPPSGRMRGFGSLSVYDPNSMFFRPGGRPPDVPYERAPLRTPLATRRDMLQVERQFGSAGMQAPRLFEPMRIRRPETREQFERRYGTFQPTREELRRMRIRAADRATATDDPRVFDRVMRLRFPDEFEYPTGAFGRPLEGPPRRRSREEIRPYPYGMGPNELISPRQGRPREYSRPPTFGIQGIGTFSQRMGRSLGRGVGRAREFFAGDEESRAASKFATLAAASIAAGMALNSLSDNLKKSEDETTRFVGSLVGASSTALQTGLALSGISKRAGILGGSLVLLIEGVNLLSEYLDELTKKNIEKGKEEASRVQIDKAKRESGLYADPLAEAIRKNLSRAGRSPSSDEDKRDKKQNNFIATLQTVAAKIGRGEAITSEKGKNVLLEEFKKSGILGQTARIEDVDRFIKEEGLKLRSSLKEVDSQLSEKLNAYGNPEATENLTENEVAFQQLMKAYGEGVVSTKSFTAAISSLSFEMAQSLTNITNSIKDIVSMNQEMTNLSQGPEKLAQTFNPLKDAVKQKEQALELARTQAGTETVSLLSDAFGTFEIEQSTAESIVDLIDSFADIGKVNISDVGDIYRTTLGKDATEQEINFAKEYLGIKKAEKEAELNLAKAISDEQKYYYDLKLQQESALTELVLQQSTAFNDFRLELSNLGTSLSKIELEGIYDELVNIKPSDIEGVISGKSKLSPIIEKLVSNAMLTGVEAAVLDLKNVGMATTIALENLDNQLKVVEKDINKYKDATKGSANYEKLLSAQLEQKNLLLEKEKIKQQGFIDTVRAGAEVKKEQTKEEKRLKEEREKQARQSKKLADATDDFNDSLKDSAKAFKNFTDEKISDLLKQDADAQMDLKNAQQEVLSSTEALSDAYFSLNEAIIEYNGILAEASIMAGMIGIDIGKLTGEIYTFSQGLEAIQDVFANTLASANISIQKRIELERQLAQETLAFLQQAQSEIISAGVGIFGQTAEENQGLGEGIAGLGYIADQLGGSFQAFQSMDPAALQNLSQTLLNLPVDFRKSILDALSSLPSTMSIGGFSVDQLRTAIGQVGAGVSDEAGLPSIADLSQQQIDQLSQLQSLAQRDAEIQTSQIVSAQESLAVAREQLDVAKIGEARAASDLEQVRIKIAEETMVLMQANQERRDLTQKIINAQDVNALRLIEKETQLFAEQNSIFQDIGTALIQEISKLASARSQLITAANPVGSSGFESTYSSDYLGRIPNFANGNLTPKEAANLLKAGAIEKSMMPAGAKLAVANTSEAVIPMNKGFIPNFAKGSQIAAGIEAVKGVNQSVVAAISRSVSESLSNIQTAGGGAEAIENLGNILTEVRNELRNISLSSTAIQANTTGSVRGGNGNAQDVRITLETSQNNAVQVSGLESLREQISQAVKETVTQQAEQQLRPLLDELDSIFIVLRERGLISSLGQPT